MKQVVLIDILSTIAIFIIKALSHLSAKVLYKVSDVLSSTAYKLKSLPFTITVRKNLQTAYLQKTIEEIREIERLHYRAVCDFVVEYILSFSSGGADVTFDYEGVDVIDATFKKHDYVICLSGHFLNYEALTQLPSKFGNVKVCYLYQPSDSKKINDYITSVREKFGAQLIPTTLSLKHILKATGTNTTRQKCFIGAMADMMPPSNHTHTTWLMGQQVTAFYGMEKIGRMLNAGVVYAKIKCKCRGRYEVSFQELNRKNSDSAFPITDSYFDMLSENIKEQPEIWMLWGTNRFNSDS